MRKPLRSRGFTLVELLVGAAVGAVVLVGISLTFISQAQQYQAHASRRALQASARQSMAFMGRQLRMAGYGVNPDRAILAYDSFNAQANASADGFPDAFVVHSRDPLFRRIVNSAAPDLLTVTEPLRAPLRRGQILLVVCGSRSSDNPPHAFVTVSEEVATGALEIPLENIPAAGAPNSPIGPPGRLFHEQDVLDDVPCFNDGSAQVVRINRFAFYVDTFERNGLSTPYLMMHQGLDVTGDGTIDINDSVPVAEGIEQLQVAYILHTPDDDPPIIRGVEAAMPASHYGEEWERIDHTRHEPGWFFNPNNRFSPDQLEDLRDEDHPANLRQVRVTLVARSSVPDPSYAGDDLMLRPDGSPYPDGAALEDGQLPWRHLENLENPVPAFTPRGGGFYRAILRESITPKNLLLNRQFVPPAPQGGG
jgi:type IV pilus assembly protein PilW